MECNCKKHIKNIMKIDQDYKDKLTNAWEIGGPEARKVMNTINFTILAYLNNEYNLCGCLEGNVLMNMKKSLTVYKDNIQKIFANTGDYGVQNLITSTYSQLKTQIDNVRI